MKSKIELITSLESKLMILQLRGGGDYPLFVESNKGL